MKTWKRTVVVPVPKGPNPNSEVKLMRPISLIPSVAKTMEMIIANRLFYWAELNGKLNASQFGFRAAKSTTDALISVIESLE